MFTALAAFLGSVGSALGSGIGSIGSALGSAVGAVSPALGSVVSGIGETAGNIVSAPFNVGAELASGNFGQTLGNIFSSSNAEQSAPAANAKQSGTSSKSFLEAAGDYASNVGKDFWAGVTGDGDVIVEESPGDVDWSRSIPRALGAHVRGRVASGVAKRKKRGETLSSLGGMQ